MFCHRFLIVSAAIAFSAAAAPARAQLVPGAPRTDWEVAQSEYRLGVLREYSAMMSGWSSALSAGEAAAAAAEYSENAQLLVSGHGMVQGRDSIAAFLRAFGSDLVELRTGLTEFLASDRLAYATGPLIYTFRQGGAGRPVTGQHVTVLVREGRRWRIHSQVLQYELPPAAGS